METERYAGIDYLRAFFSVWVVVGHLGYVSPSLIFDQDGYLNHTFAASDFVNFYVIIPSVPVFFIVSNFLFFRRSAGSPYLWRYLKRIAKIALFWIVLHAMFKYRGWEILDWLPRTAKHFVGFFVSGGWTIYYFFVSLMVLTVLVHWCRHLNVVRVAVLFSLSTLLVALLPLIAMETGYFDLCLYWNPLNFIPYPFAAMLVSHVIASENKGIKNTAAIAFAVAALLLALLDWHVYVDRGFFEVNLYAVPAFSRPSIVFIAMLLLLLATGSPWKESRLAVFMAGNSLALYCLHPFFLEPAERLSLGNLPLSLLLVLVLSYSTAMVARRFIRQELLR